MFPAQRRRQIAQQINELGYVSITNLCEQFQVSEMTIHRDLYALEEMGQIMKTRGGAVSQKSNTPPVSYRARMAVQEDLKDRIGKKAVEFIRKGDTIFLDASTTCMYIAKNLGNFEKLIVYTNGPMVIVEMAEKKGVDVYTTGGQLSKDTTAFVGPSAEAVLKELRPDKCFIGAFGISVQEGIMDPYYPEASVKRAIVQSSQEVYLVAASDKFDRTGPHITASLEMIDAIITDSSIEEKHLNALNDAGIRCFIA